MKKQGAKPLRPVPPGGEVGHLDEKLTEITTTTAQRLKKWRVPLIALAGALVAIQVGYLAVRGIEESKQVRWNQEIYEIFDGPAARKEGYVLDPARLEKLLSEVRGDPMEGHVYRTAAQFHLERARELEEKASGRGSAFLDPAGATGADPTAGERALEALERAAALAQEAANRLPADEDIQLWAGVVKAKAAAEKEAAWSKAKRKYAPPALPQAAAAATPTDTAPETPTDTAPETPTDTAPETPTDTAPDPAPAGGEATPGAGDEPPEKGSG